MDKQAENPTSQDRVVLVAREGEAREACLQELEALSMPVDVYDTIRGAHEALKNLPARGVVMDFDTKLTLPRPEKLLDHEIARVYPVLMVKWGGSELKVARQFSNASSMEEFVDRACADFDARVLRSASRKESCFNVVLSSDSRFSDDQIERTVTLNISRQGCFLFSTREGWQPGQRAWLLFKELHFRAPVKAGIQWYNAWGQQRHYSGIGVLFEEMPKEQIDELVHLA